MKNYKLYVGIDISKLKLDVSFVTDPCASGQDHIVVPNNAKGFKLLSKEIRKRHGESGDALVCFENTGIYGMPLAMYLSGEKADYSIVPALEIKRSKGIRRGKSDKSDSLDIALYAITHRHKIVLYELPETDILKLQLLHNQRERLLKAMLLLSRGNDTDGFLPKEMVQEAQSLSAGCIKKLQESVRQAEGKMLEIIKSNERMKKQYGLATSVPGVGQQVAIALLVATRCYSAFREWRQFACYAGIAPFEHSSGTSIRGRTKVSQMGDKRLKALLTMSALAAKKGDTSLANYYKKKTSEGKNPMLVINAIRCKVVARVFAAVKRGTPYVDTLKFAA